MGRDGRLDFRLAGSHSLSLGFAERRGESWSPVLAAAAFFFGNSFWRIRRLWPRRRRGRAEAAELSEYRVIAANRARNGTAVGANPGRAVGSSGSCGSPSCAAPTTHVLKWTISGPEGHCTFGILAVRQADEGLISAQSVLIYNALRSKHNSDNKRRSAFVV